MTKPKIAIACQGGGSQTAFTAGALRTLFLSFNGCRPHCPALTCEEMGRHLIGQSPTTKGMLPVPVHA